MLFSYSEPSHPTSFPILLRVKFQVISIVEKEGFACSGPWPPLQTDFTIFSLTHCSSDILVTLVFFEHTSLLPQGLCSRFCLSWNVSHLDTCMASSCTSLRTLLKCNLMRGAYLISLQKNSTSVLLPIPCFIFLLLLPSTHTHI